MQEKAIQQQGLPPVETPVSSEPLDPAEPISSSMLPTPTNITPHQFTLPPNTAGQAATRVCVQPQPLPASNYVWVLPTPTSSATLSTSVTPSSSSSSPPTKKVPYSTQSYRKKKKKEEESFVVLTKRYKERSGPSICSKCGEPRTGGHKQFFGNWYCPSMTESYKVWRAQFGDKYKKKQKK